MHLQLHCTPFISYGRSAHAHARHPSPRFVLSLSPFPPSSSFLFETSLQRAVSFLPLHPAPLARARSSPSNFVFSFLLERQTCSASSPLLLLPLLLLPKRKSEPIPALPFSFTPFLSRSSHHASRFSRPYLGYSCAPRRTSLSLPHPPADRTHTGVAHYPI